MMIAKSEFKIVAIF